MEFINVYYDFIYRTEENLRTIQGLAKSDNSKAFEVTQLINSLLGLIVLPKEKELIRGSDTLQRLEKDGWILPRRTGGNAKVSTLLQLVRQMRHGIAHWNIQFHSKNKAIVEIQIENRWKKMRKGKQEEVFEWGGAFTVDALHNFVIRLADLSKNRAANLK